MTVVKIIDLFEIFSPGKIMIPNTLKDYSLKLILETIIKRLNMSDMEIELSDHDPILMQVTSVLNQSEKEDIFSENNDFEEIPVEQIRTDNTMKNEGHVVQVYSVLNEETEALSSLNSEEVESVSLLPEQVSNEYAEVKHFIEKMQAAFGENIEETMKYIKLAADLAKNNRLRQIYFHEEIYKRVRPDEPDKEFKPMRRGPREIIIRKAMDLAKDESTKIGDLTESKEELLREEKLLSQMVEKEDILARKSEKEQERKVLEPISSSQDITIERLNELIKEHESIKCSLEFLIYHVNTLADFIEASLPVVFANDPNFEGLQQRIREIHLIPSEYIVTKQLQQELVEFYEIFIKRTNIMESKITKHSALLQRHDFELYSKIENLKRSLEDIEVHVNKIIKQIKKKTNTVKDNGEWKELLEHLNEDVIKITTELNNILGKQKIMLTTLETHQCLLKEIKEAIFKLKGSKLEKIELEKLLSTKADCSLLNSKVSESDFSLAYNDLTNGLTSVSNQLEAQNFIWEALIKKVNDNLSSVVGKIEFEEYGKNMSNLILTLQNNLNEIKETFDTEASGTKTKFLRNLKCISCNQNRVMKKSNNYPQFPALPKLPPPKKNKLDLPLSNQNDGISTNSNLTNRYVGGSHTIIKPNEKVFKQEVITYSEVLNN